MINLNVMFFIMNSVLFVQKNVIILSIKKLNIDLKLKGLEVL